MNSDIRYKHHRNRLPSLGCRFLLIVCLLVGSTLSSYAEEITLLFAGDAMLHQGQIDNAYRDGQYDFSSYFPYIEYEVSRADLAVVNLEVTLGGKPYRGYPQFSAPDEYAIALKEAGFDVFLTANNHILDRRNKGLIRTLNILDSLEVKHTGAFRNSDEREEVYPLFIEKKGVRFALLNYTYGTNGLTAQAPVQVNYIDKKQIREDIRKAREGHADIIIANMHWGVEYKLVQNKEQEALAQFLIDEGVELIIGSHPHVVQPSQLVYNEAGEATNLVVYSMGNLVSNMTATNTDGGQLIKVILEKEEEKVRIKCAGYMLVYRHRAKKGNKLDFQVIPVSLSEKITYPIVDDAVEIPEADLRKMELFSKNARALFEKHNNGVSEYKMRLTPPKERQIPKILPSLFGN